MMTDEERNDAIDFFSKLAEKETNRVIDAKHSRLAIEALKQEPCHDNINRQAMIEALNKMDRYVADELTLCGTERKFPKNEVFIVDDVYDETVEQLPHVIPQPQESEGKIEFHVGDIVVVTAKHPDGSETVTKGDIGIITEKKVTEFGIDYTVHTWSSNYLYGDDQIRLATQEEKDAKLIDLMMK